MALKSPVRLTLDMLRFLIFACLFINLDAATAADCHLSARTPIVVATSNDGLTKLTLNQSPTCLTVYDGNGARSILIKDIDEVKDILPNPTVSLSFDAKYAAVEFEAGEDDHVVLVLRLDNLRTVLVGKFQSATWMQLNNKLLLVPNYGMMELQKTRGIILYSPDLNQRKSIANEYFFLGKVEVDGNQIVADIVEYKGENQILSTIKYDFLKRKLIAKSRLESK
ncbi:hypothetical protein RF679_09585 [Undibacterium cyanobacteriorum]|uniref:Uncharacterized protein n=1 Tax=Undibacterium cyanobacteriorum TaxID=3073561 RepID=A0ABY9RCF1_9BURK|nr:hypothetical protein [Undibacterium sp. 20NA77.5]WMW78918.1 hypothetical protein RF679_09585 [Undibacterium sp. 20NA77.5]